MTPFTEEHKRKIGDALRGKPKLWLIKDRIERVCPCGNKFYLTEGKIREKHGKFCSRSCYYKYRDNKFIGNISHERAGEAHWNFKNEAGYSALHLRVQSVRGKASICEKCGSTKYVEWANKTGQYEDVNDYLELCRKCHHKYDNIQIKGWQTRRAGDVSA